MTLGQQAVQQAVQQTGYETLKKAALRMLDKKFDIKLISEVTQLTPKEIKRLAKKKAN